MHELSLIQSLLEMVEELGAEKGFQRVGVLRLSFGRLSCVDPQALRFAFDVEAPGTGAAGAELVFDILPGVLYCFACEEERTMTSHELQCPVCGGRQVILTGGTEELKLMELEVD